LIVTAELRSLPQDQPGLKATAVAGKKPEMPSATALTGIARKELRSLAAALRKTKAGQSVHGARRRIKRLRSLLRLLRVPMGEEAFLVTNDGLRNAADALAGPRRAEALVVAAARLGSRRAHAPWLQIAEANRAAQLASPAEDTGPEAARKSVEAVAAAMDKLRLKPASAPDIEEAFIATYRKARKRLEHGFASGDVEDLHTARKHVIHHIHHLDLLRAHLAGPSKRLAALEKLREALGDLNDLDELSQLAADGMAELPEAAAAAMARKRAVLVKQAEKAAGRLFRHKPKAFRNRIGAMWTRAAG
jgi:CHAD domain-containing protein